MSKDKTRILGRILAVEEMNAVSGARTLPESDNTILASIFADTGTSSDSGTTADSGTASDSGTAVDTNPSPLFARDAPPSP